MRPLDWVEKLPDRWQAKPLRSIAICVVSNVDKLTLDDEIQVRLCNYTEVYHNEFIDLELDFMNATASENEIEKFGLSVNDVMITKDSESWNDIGVPALVRETADDLVCGYHLALLHPHNEVVYGPFIFRCLQAKSIRLQLELSARGVTRFGLSKSEIGSMILPVPPFPQQRAIADHLDRETARLDALVAAKQRLLNLLTEKRQALITCAVTRGIAPGAVMCEWDTPAEGGDHATVGASGEVSAAVLPIQRKLKYLANINGEVLGENTDPDFEILYIDIGNVDSSGKIGEVSVYRFEDSPSRARRRVRDGDVIISTVRTYLQAIAQIQNPPENMIASTGFSVVRPLSKFDANYCKYVLRDRRFLAEVEKRSVGVSYPAINAIDLANIPVHIHPLVQQRAIADYLDRETAQLDELATKTRKTIALLKERRAAFIAAAVTGQIDVEDAA